MEDVRTGEVVEADSVGAVRRYGKGVPGARLKKVSFFQAAVFLVAWIVFVTVSALNQLEGTYWK